MTWVSKPGERAMYKGRECFVVDDWLDEGGAPVAQLAILGDEYTSNVSSCFLTPPPEWDVIEAAREMISASGCGCIADCGDCYGRQRAADSLRAALARYDEVANG